MVKDNKEMFNTMFDTMNESMKAAVEFGRRTQETFFSNAGEKFKVDNQVCEFQHRANRSFEAFTPFVQKNVEAGMTLVDANSKAGMAFFRTGIDATQDVNADNLQQKTREFFDASFKLFKHGLDNYADATNKAVNNFNELFKVANTTCCEGKEKSAKAGGK